MNRCLLKKSLLEARALFLACGALMFAYSWVRVWLVSRLDTSRFQSIIELLPGEWTRFSPVDIAWLVTYTGRIAVVYDEPIIVVGMAIWAIARGSDCVSGELNRGTMELLLAQPVSRLQILFTQAGVTIAGAALLALAVWAGTAVGVSVNTVEETIAPKIETPIPGIELPNPFAEPTKVRVPMDERVDLSVYANASANLFCLGFFLAGLTSLMSSWDRYRWRTIGLVVGVYIVHFVLKMVGLAVDEWRWLLFGSFFTAYEPEEFVSIAAQTPEQTWSLLRYDSAGVATELGPLGYDLVLLGLGFACYLAAGVIFHRRDLPAPL
jgi:ABC-2 type transport system permease protein